MRRPVFRFWKYWKTGGGKTSTVVVAQRSFDTWHEILGDPTMADAIRDRLFSNAEKIELKGKSLGKTPRIIDSNLPPH